MVTSSTSTTTTTAAAAASTKIYESKVALRKNSRYSCVVCKKHFARLDSFKQHLASHDPASSASSSSCPECGLKFGWATSLRRHREKCHGLPCKSLSLPCDQCDRVFKTKVHLKVHVERDHDKVRRHLCQICDKTFYAHNDLVSHTRVHTGDKPYKCRYCPKGFSHGSHRVRHERLKHQEEEQRRCNGSWQQQWCRCCSSWIQDKCSFLKNALWWFIVDRQKKLNLYDPKDDSTDINIDITERMMNNLIMMSSTLMMMQQ